MNINSKLINILKTATSLPVAQDMYDGTEDKFITFTYQAERPEAFGDNKPIADTVYLQIQLWTPKKYNYLTMKDTIRDALENNDFIVTSMRSFLGDAINGTEKIRDTIIEAEYTASR